MKTIHSILFIPFFTIIFITNGYSQNITQTVKGKVVDVETKQALIGATLTIANSNPIIGTTTDVDGNYWIKNVPVGRHNLKISYMGYQEVIIPEILIGSGKELVVNVEMKENVVKLNTFEIKAFSNKGETMNSMTTVSARSFNVEETRRYAGGFDDPGRLASAFAGVSTNGSVESNAIIVRGNSPTGVMWQVEGVEIPVPSHFANADVMGGGAVTLFSNQILNNSDFFTGAFPAEYGNATSGVFDVKLRTGNNEKYENAFQIGAMGIDFSSEGPLKKGKKASYLFNYRYSTLGLLQSFLPEQGLPEYQDLCFKLNLPTSKIGTFSVWGIGGIDKFTNKAKEDPKEWTDNHARLNINSNFYPGTGAINHLYLINNKTYLNSMLSVSSYTRDEQASWYHENKKYYPIQESKYEEYKYSFKTYLNHKFNARHSNKTGFIGNVVSYNYNNLKADRIADSITSLFPISSGKGNSSYYQFYTQSKYNITEDFSLNAGIHSIYFDLNKKYSIDPRIGCKWEAMPRHTFSLAYGKHSQLQMLNTYFIEKNNNGTITLPNKNLDFSNAHHYVFSYDFIINENMRIKIEPYYQSLSNIPVEDSTYFSMVNIEEGHGFNKILTNKGKGSNIGIDFTFERFLNKGFYYLFTASYFDSKYKDGDGIERNTLYNSNYVINILGGKEWKIKQNNILGLSGRIYVKGGNRKTPVDREQSLIEKDVIYDYSKAYQEQWPMMYRLDMSANYRINKSKVSHIFTLQINNVLASPTVFDEVYDYNKNDINKIVKGEPFPSISWKIEF